MYGLVDLLLWKIFLIFYLDNGVTMNRKKTKTEIKELKKGLKTAKRASDARLAKLALILVIIAVVAGFIYGRIQL